MNLAKPRSLAFRLYLAALAQLVAAWLGFSISREYLIEPPGRVGRGGWEVFAAQHVAFERNHPRALRDTMEWLRVELGLRVTLFDPDGRVVASNHSPVPAAVDRARAAALPVRDVAPGDTSDTYLVGIHDEDRLVGYVVTDRFRFRRSLSKQLVLVLSVLIVVLVGSLSFARSLVRPLRRLARAARAFGQGELHARAGVQRRDELGEVAQAFDDMADRITALLQSQRELLANVSHELRTPLARIRVALDLAAEGDAAAARDALSNITSDWGDLERLVEDVLSAARLDLGSSAMGALPLRQDDVDLAALAEAAATRYRIVYPKETLTLDLASPLPSIRGDGALLRRVLDNLLDNARKYSDPGTDVTLRISANPDGVHLSVADQGMGITQEDLPHIFTPFFRADRSRNRKTGGVGMGLALVRRIVAAHQGQVEAKSSVGKGSVFHVRLPRGEGQPHGLAEPRPPLRAPSPATEVPRNART